MGEEPGRYPQRLGVHYQPDCGSADGIRDGCRRHGQPIEDVIGGSGPGTNILVGDGGDTLVGGSGRDLLIAGATASSLSGGGNDDILIGGSNFLRYEIPAGFNGNHVRMDSHRRNLRGSGEQPHERRRA